MMTSFSGRITFALVILVASAFVGGIVLIFFSQYISPTREATPPPVSTAASDVAGRVVFNPPPPKDAPPAIRDAVLLGYNILMNTQKYAPQYVGNKLNCRNCHFEAGRVRKTLSLVGVAATYPKYRKRQNYSVDLVTRTNDCFIRSMNGKPLPAESKEMQAIMAYYHWISKGLPIYAKLPWLGLAPIKSDYKPSAKKGRTVFKEVCSPCHGDHGQGTPIAPPLWGNGSFNDGAGMDKPKNLSAFALHFMPKGNPTLSVEQALDVAAFVTAQPRPHLRTK